MITNLYILILCSLLLVEYELVFQPINHGTRVANIPRIQSVKFAAFGIVQRAYNAITNLS